MFGFRYLCVYESYVAADKHEGSYAPLLDFAKGVQHDGYYEIKVKAEAKNRKNPYDPAIFAMDPAMPFRLGVVPGNYKMGPLHDPQPIEPLLGETVVKDGEPDWYTFKVWLDAGHTPRFVFPNGMNSVRNAYAQDLSPVQVAIPGRCARGEDARRHRDDADHVPEVRSVAAHPDSRGADPRSAHRAMAARGPNSGAGRQAFRRRPHPRNPRSVRDRAPTVGRRLPRKSIT